MERRMKEEAWVHPQNNFLVVRTKGNDDLGVASCSSFWFGPTGTACFVPGVPMRAFPVWSVGWVDLAYGRHWPLWHFRRKKFSTPFLVLRACYDCLFLRKESPKGEGFGTFSIRSGLLAPVHNFARGLGTRRMCRIAAFCGQYSTMILFSKDLITIVGIFLPSFFSGSISLSREVMSQVKSSGANPRLITSNVGSIDRRIGMFQKLSQGKLALFMPRQWKNWLAMSKRMNPLLSQLKSLLKAMQG
ncbi:hypothetical protein L1987_49632 [Smallanthus sonchifolius]|uniref:Uncharacterized protein n=1 Tax=Smallanthus sonchifolius TaxID=185202 RepID=A0ACB9FV19_9ASTR|nr:hypothetical protein L1987_49632 [Smallanthus sonchifolius]